MSHDGIRDASQVWPDLQSNTDEFSADQSGGFQSTVPRQSGITLRAYPTWDDSGVKATDSTDQDQRSVSGRRRGASGGGGANGNPLRIARGRNDQDRPFFDIDVPPNGYAWWYIDGIETGGEGRAISIIGFIGSVFSPWYAWSGRKSPMNHCCINVATYGPGGRFTMTDRGTSALRTSADVFEVGPSKMEWTGDKLVIHINEIGGPPIPGRVSGTVTVTPRAITNVELPLTEDGAHIWRPFSPTSDIDVNLEAKGWQWKGHGYFDSNFGTRALEQDFSYWTWGRYPLQDGSVCFYDADRRDGSALSVGIQFDEENCPTVVQAPPKTKFRNSLWQVRRETRADTGYRPRQVRNMLDAPFYSRSMVRTQFDGQETTGVHEALDLDRFANPLIKPMLACRVPRRSNWTF